MYIGTAQELMLLAKGVPLVNLWSDQELRPSGAARRDSYDRLKRGSPTVLRRGTLWRLLVVLFLVASCSNCCRRAEDAGLKMWGLW